MTLVINIGNTNVTIALMDASKIIYKETHPTRECASAINFKDILAKFDPEHTEGIILSSVVPHINELIIKAVKEQLNNNIVILSHELNMSIRLDHLDKFSVGSDRIAVCEGAAMSLNPPFIVFDFGTAITINVVDSNYNFLGGPILIGLTSSMLALASNTALLPYTIDEVSSHLGNSVIGNTTQSCLASGLINGNICMMEGISARIENELSSKCNKIITGGDARYVCKYCNDDYLYNENLLLQGLQILYNKNNKF